MNKLKPGLAHLAVTGALLAQILFSPDCTRTVVWAEAPATVSKERPAAPAPPACQFCPVMAGLHGTLELGAAYVSDDSFDFGDLRGLEDKGSSLISNMDLRYWGEEARYWELSGFDLGRDTRALSMKGGRQGKYKVRLAYDKIPRRFFDTAMTPYRGAGSETLTLPAAWVTANTTGGMSALSGSLQPMAISQDRENVRVGLIVSPSETLEYTIHYRHENREGLRLRSGHFVSFSTVFPEPLNVTTDEIEASLRYATDRGQVRFAYYGSFFNNSDQSVTWENPFTPLTAGADRGRLALPPDNQAHQIALSGSYQFTEKTRVSGSVSLGQMTQDETFIPTTLNTNIAASLLPGASPDAKVKTARVHFDLLSIPTPKLTLRLIYALSDRDNETPRKTYDFVESDTFLAGTRTNLPYSYRKQDLDLKSTYRFKSNLKFSGGVELEQVNRDFQETSQTDETTIWFKLKASDKMGRGYGSLKISHADRNGNRYVIPDTLETAQNPLMRKVNLADRDRNLVTAHIASTPLDWVALGFTTEISRDEYSASEVGLTNSDHQHLAVDLAFTLPKNIRLYTLVSREWIQSRQHGSQGFGLPDWLAVNKDTMDTAGAGFFIPQIFGRCDLGFDFIYAASNGLNAITPAGGEANTFPNLKSRLTRTKLHLNYRHSRRIRINALVLHEKQNQSDWAQDGVAVDAVTNAITSGVIHPDYEVYLIGLSLSYSFSNE